jgi:hypothetical protein
MARSNMGDTKDRSPRCWPDGTGLWDYARAATPEQVHGVALGLDFSRRANQTGAWIYEGLSADSESDPDWRAWYPGTTAPDWWKVQDRDGIVHGIVHLEVVDPDETTLGYLWLRAYSNNFPIIYCHQSLREPAILVTPEMGIPFSSKEEVRQFMAAVSSAPFPGPFRQVDAADPKTFTDVFGGYFTPGGHRFDWIMGVAMDHSVHIPGFSKLHTRVGGMKKRGRS